MASGVLRSWAADAREFVVLRKRSRNCSNSRAISSIGSEAPACAAAAVFGVIDGGVIDGGVIDGEVMDGRPSFGGVPVGAAAGLFSDIEAMGEPIAFRTL